MSAETLYKICENHEGIVEYLLLGRQSTNGNTTPAVQMLSEIPPTIFKDDRRYSQSIYKNNRN